MTTYFNAVVRAADKKLIAKTYLTDLGSVPWTWKVTYDKRELIGKRLFNSVLCSPSRPLVISKRVREGDSAQSPLPSPVSSKIYKIMIISLRGEQVRLEVNSSHTVKDLLYMANRQLIQPCTYGGSLIFLKNQNKLYTFSNAERDNAFQLLEEYKVDQDPVNRATFIYAHRLPGGGRGTSSVGFEFVDVEGKIVSGIGKESIKEEDFKAYDKGLNFIGKCYNESCVSQRYLPKGKVMYNLGFRPFVQLTPSRCTFVCPACHDYRRETFKVSNILVSGAKAEIRYRKERQAKVKTVTLESEYPKYVTFEDGRGDEVNQGMFQWIEIRTVPMDKSLYDCAVCDEKIRQIADECKKACGHAFHTDCLKDCDDCIVCFANIIADVLLKETLP